jgi:hypothetical protein
LRAFAFVWREDRPVQEKPAPPALKKESFPPFVPL